MTTLNDPLVQAAAEFARAAHAGVGQKHRYTGEPYAVHLETVARIVAEVTDDPEVVAVAWLHDTVEDTKTEVEEISENFGTRVARLVDDLTDVSRPEDSHRKGRKNRDRTHLSHALPAAQTVKLADLIDNALSISAHDPSFARIYLDKMEELLTVLSKGDAGLQKRARVTLEECRQMVSVEGKVAAKVAEQIGG